jgi:hypothetical protein
MQITRGQLAVKTVPLALEDHDGVINDLVDQAVAVIDSARPEPIQVTGQALWFA